MSHTTMASTLRQWKMKHVAAAVACAAALGLLAWQLMAPRSMPMARTAMLVDVTTGQLYEMSVEGGLMVPERNPESRALTLMPVEQSEGGDWSVPSRMMTSISMIEGTPAAITDRRTGAVKVNGEPARKVRPLPVS